MAGRPRKVEEKMAESTEDAGTNAPQTEEIVVKSLKAPKSLVVTASTPIEVVIKSDSEGVDLLFDQKDEFLMLEEGVVRALSRENRVRYSSARQFHDTWRGQQDVEFSEAFSVDKEFVGKASDKLNDREVRSGIRARWTRPDMVSKRTAQGYKILSSDEARTYLGPKGSHHEISKNGKTELVLMGVTEDIYQKRQKEKQERNVQLSTAWKRSGVQQLTEKGGRAFVESERDESYRWNDLSNGGSEE